MAYYAIHIKQGRYALDGDYPVVVDVYRYTNKPSRDLALRRMRINDFEANGWYNVVASDKLVASAKFFAERGATWPVTLHIEDANATPRNA